MTPLCRTHPYPITENRSKRSPLKTRKAAKQALTDHKKGKSIGFTRRSSLKSMGILPRSNGCYELGPKYRTL